MLEWKRLVVYLVFLSVLSHVSTAKNSKLVTTTNPADKSNGGVINLTAGDKPCFCPSKWRGVPFPTNLCGKEIIKLIPNSDCKPEYAYQCLALGERAIATRLCPNTENSKICGPLRHNSYDFEANKEYQYQIRECGSAKNLKGYILENHNGEFTSWKYVGA